MYMLVVQNESMWYPMSLRDSIDRTGAAEVDRFDSASAEQRRKLPSTPLRYTETCN